MRLEIDDVAHSFGDRLALDGVSFDIGPGVITGLLGPNGAGKTTLPTRSATALPWTGSASRSHPG